MTTESSMPARTTPTDLLAVATILFLTSCSSMRPGVGLYGGIRELQDDVEPVESQDVYGAAFEMKARDGGVGLEVGGFQSKDEGTLVGPGFQEVADVELREAFAGLRWDFGPETNRVRPYVGAGASYVSVDASVNDTGTLYELDDESVGAYAHAGVMFRITDHIGIGVDARVLYGTEVGEGDESFAADYLQGAAALSISF